MSGNCNSAVMSTVVFVLLCLRVRCDGNHKSWGVSNKNCDSNIRAKGTNLDRDSGPKMKFRNLKYVHVGIHGFSSCH
jgi:hypothetical protein